MIRNPIHLRLEKMEIWQYRTFMACLCTRMYFNYALFCQETQFADPNKLKNIVDLGWESLLVKNAKIDFDSQLEKLEDLIPSADDYDIYIVHPAIDACRAIGELLHSYLSGENAEHAIEVSKISLNTIANFEINQSDIEFSDDELKNLPSILDELDLQWEIYRLLKEQETFNFELIKGLKDDIYEAKTSNIGYFMSS